MVQYYYFSLKVVNRLGLRLFVNENHTFAEVVSFQLLFLDLRLDGEADGLACDGLVYVDALMMDAFDLHRVELALFVRA